MALLLLFALYVIAEIATLSHVAEALGTLDTVALFILAKVVGISLLRAEGVALAARLFSWGEQAAETGRAEPLPVAASIPPFCAGILLLIPGFLTDALALAVLVPPMRWVVSRRVGRLFEQGARVHPFPGRGRPEPGPSGPIIIDGEVVSSREVRPDGLPERAGGPLLLDAEVPPRDAPPQP